MSCNSIFDRIYKLTHEDGRSYFSSILLCSKNDESRKENPEKTTFNFQLQKTFIEEIFKEIDDLANELKNDDTILISVRNQKLLRTCFQLVTSIGISSCLIPGLGISLSKRCSSSTVLPSLRLTDEQKYDMLVACTEFFIRCYEVSMLKNIIITFHLSDYLAALMQLSFAPLKKPGTYTNFTMTREMYDQLNLDKQKYVHRYESVVANCFQPILMKELLVLQSAIEPPIPVFAKRVISKEMSRQLLLPGGLLSLIRCFIETYDIDTGFEWGKIDMICKIIGVKHGSDTEEIYLNNICAQITQILKSSNSHYLTAAVACVLCLNGKYPESVPVKELVAEIFQSFHYDVLVTKSNFPGTVILSPQEIEHKVNALHAFICTTKLACPYSLLLPNLYVLFLLGLKCTKNEDLKIKLKDIVLKFLLKLNKNDMHLTIKTFLFGKEDLKLPDIIIDEYEVGLSIKSNASHVEHPGSDAIVYVLNLFNSLSDTEIVQNLFETFLLILIDLNTERQRKANKEVLLTMEDDVVLFDDTDEQYANILHLLSEISTSPKVVSSLKANPSPVLHFVEHFISKAEESSSEECVTIALVLLNIILSNSNETKVLKKSLATLTPVLNRMIKNGSGFNNILCNEVLSLITTEEIKQTKTETAYGQAISNVYDNLLPVRAHGIIELTKLIDDQDPETISKRHYIFCLFHEQLTDPDSYIYLSAINGLAALGTHCTEDVLQVLCREFLHVSDNQVGTKGDQNKIAELRMKIGDVIVKVTRRLGEMAIVHKNILLNTVLCGCRDEDPLIRTSALSNLAEIALVLHYKIGSIIYEVLLCIWSIIETDKAIECRRAAVMVIASLIKGLGKENLLQLKENLLPVYRSLKNIYRDTNEDSVVRLHAQIALEELNDAVNQFLLPDLPMEKQIFVMDKP